MANVDVKVILKLVDGLTGPAKKAADSLKKIVDLTTKLTKAGGGLNALPKQFQALNTQVANLGKVSTASTKAMSSGLAGAASATTKLAADVKILSAAETAAAAGAKSLAASMASLNSQGGWAKQQASSMQGIISAQKQIIANNKRMATSVPSIGGAGAGGHGSGLLGGYIGYRAAHEVGHGLKETFLAGADYQRETALAHIGGRTVEEIKEMQAKALELSHSVAMTSQAESLKQQNEAIMAVGDVSHMLNFAKKFAENDALVAAVTGERQEGQSFHLMKSLEQVGATKAGQEDRANSLIDMWGQSIAASRGRITAQAISSATNYMKSSKYAAGDEFMGRVLPALIMQSQRPSTVGQELMSLAGYVVGNRVPMNKVPDLVKAGLIDPSKVVRDEHSPNKQRLEPGAWYGSSDYLKNPFEWVVQHFGDMAKREGLTTAEEISKRVNELIPNRNVADAIQEAIINQSQIRKDVALATNAPKAADAIQFERAHDFKAAAMDLSAGMADLGKAFSGPFVEPVIHGMNNLADTARTVGSELSDHPFVAASIATSLVGGLVRFLPHAISTSLAGTGIGYAIGGPMGALVGGMLGKGMLGGARTAAVATAAEATAVGAGLASSVGAGLLFALKNLNLAALVSAALVEAIQNKESITRSFDNLLGGPENPASAEGIKAWRSRRFGRGSGFVLHAATPISAPAVPELAPKLPEVFGGDLDSSGISRALAASDAGGSKVLDSVISRAATDAKPAAAEAGASLGQTVVDAFKSAIEAIGNIHIPMPSVPSAAPAAAPAASGAHLGHASVKIDSVVVHNNISGGDPKQVAEAVHRKFVQSYESHLSDGHYVLA
jgi:hypothetical protein